MRHLVKIVSLVVFAPAFDLVEILTCFDLPGKCSALLDT
jgi:hypothetical protein